MNLDIKKQIISSSDVIKNKLKQLRDIELQNNYELDKIFKPVTEPLTEILTSNKTKSDLNLNVNPIRIPVKFENICTSTPLVDKKGIENNDTASDSEYYSDGNENIDISIDDDAGVEASITKKYLSGLNDDINIPFGIRKEGHKLMIGNVEVKLTSSGNDEEPTGLKIDDNEYQLSTGLKEVLFCKRPKLDLVTEDDKIVYKQILTRTNAHKRDYLKEGQLKGDKGKKYQYIIKPMFATKNSDKRKRGGNLPNLKKLKSNTDFIYWDDPNELVERLKLLIASKHAGNTSHDNEIISIVEELKEAGIIET